VFGKKINLIIYGIKVFAQLFSNFFLQFSAKLTLRVFGKKIKLSKFGIKVFAQLFSKFFSSILCKINFASVWKENQDK
jgi:hypothetical protein